MICDRFAFELLAMEIAAQYKSTIVFDFMPIEAKEGVLGFEVADLQNAIDLSGDAGPIVNERQFGFDQCQII